MNTQDLHIWIFRAKQIELATIITLLSWLKVAQNKANNVAQYVLSYCTDAWMGQSINAADNTMI